MGVLKCYSCEGIKLHSVGGASVCHQSAGRLCAACHPDRASLSVCGRQAGSEWKPLFMSSMPLWSLWSQKSVLQNERLFSVFRLAFISFTHLRRDPVLNLLKKADRDHTRQAQCPEDSKNRSSPNAAWKDFLPQGSASFKTWIPNSKCSSYQL